MTVSERRAWLVTGANSGFGRAIVEAAIAAGDVAIAAARRPSSLDDLATGLPGQVDAVELDVANHAQIQTVVKDAVSRHGRIDVPSMPSLPTSIRSAAT